MAAILPGYDTHVHSAYSGHSSTEMTPDAVRRAASSLGLEAVVMLEHVPQIMPGETPHDWYSRKDFRGHLNGLFGQIDALNEDGEKPLLLRGTEVDADPVAMDGSAMLEDFTGVLFPLLTTHFIPGGGAFWYNAPPVAGPAAEVMLARYVDWMLATMDAGRYRALAHPGVMLASAGLVGDFSAASIEAIEPVFAKMRERDVAFELNELVAKKLSRPYIGTYPEMVAVARAWGVRFVVGSDAHSPGNVGRRRWLKHVASEAGLGVEDFLDVDELTAASA